MKEKNILAGESDSILLLHVMITNSELLSVFGLGRTTICALTVCPPLGDKFLKWKSKPGCTLRKSMAFDLAPYD